MASTNAQRCCSGVYLLYALEFESVPPRQLSLNLFDSRISKENLQLEFGNNWFSAKVFGMENHPKLSFLCISAKAISSLLWFSILSSAFSLFYLSLWLSGSLQGKVASGVRSEPPLLFKLLHQVPCQQRTLAHPRSWQAPLRKAAHVALMDLIKLYLQMFS